MASSRNGTKVHDRIALIEHTPKGPRARYTFVADPLGKARAEARITELVKASTNEFSLVPCPNQPN